MRFEYEYYYLRVVDGELKIFFEVKEDIEFSIYIVY